LAQGPESRQHHDTLDEINSLADRLRDWIAGNPVPIAVGAGLALAVAAGFGGWQAWRARTDDRASTAIAAIERDYLKAMGASPGSTEIVEPANPETGKSIRREYSEKFLAAAAEHSRARAAWAARVQAGDLLLAAGEPQRAIETWQEAAAAMSAGDSGRGIVLQRIAAAQESTGHWKEAAEAWHEAAGLPDYPLRTLALAQAARCFREAGETARAVEAARGIESAVPGSLDLPPHLQAIVGELKSQAAATPSS
jgi:predicted negative regulator of RcsB-dependent stress response